MSVSATEFRSGLTDSQVTWLQNNAPEWTDEAIVERFDNGKTWCDGQFCFGELHRLVNGAPSSSQENYFHNLMSALLVFAGLKPVVRSDFASGEWEAFRLARTQQYRLYCKSTDAVITFAKVASAMGDRDACSSAIGQLVRITNAMGISLPRAETTPELPSAENLTPAQKGARTRAAKRAAAAAEEPF